MEEDVHAAASFFEVAIGGDPSRSSLFTLRKASNGTMPGLQALPSYEQHHRCFSSDHATCQFAKPMLQS